MSLGGGRGPEKTTYGEGMESDGRKGEGREERGQWRAEQTNTGSAFISCNITVPPDK